MALSLRGVCDAVAQRFNLDAEEVRNAVLDAPFASDAPERERSPRGKQQRAGSDKSRRRGPRSPNATGPSVEDLRRMLDQQDAASPALPVLLRFAVGEFHYGQRATRALPGQKLRPKVPVAHPKEDVKVDQTPKAVFEAFDVLASEATMTQTAALHQTAGWKDLDDVQIWKDYVTDVMDGLVRENDRVFEAGCGVLAFLREVETLAPGVVIGGVDGAARTISLVQTELAPAYRDNFSVGLLPEAMDAVPDESWDIVVCNSVFQYFATLDQAEAAVNGMIRTAKRWVVLADICDAVHAERTIARQQANGWCSDLPSYLSYERSWFSRFEKSGNLVSIRHVRVKGYERRTERYCVYIEKGAA